MPPPLPSNPRASLLQGVKASIAASLFGVLILFLSCLLLWKNEGRAIKTARGLAEGSAAVISVDSRKTDPKNEAKLVHLAGPVTTTAPLEDAAFGIQQKALRLVRTVEMYQWREKSDSVRKTGGGDADTGTTLTYKYEKAWDSTPLDSSRYNQRQGHENPPAWRFRGETWLARDARLDAYHLPDRLIAKLDGDVPLPLGQGVVDFKEPNPPQNSGNTLYFGANPSVPQVGDLRVTYRILQPGPFSVIGRQSGDSITPYPTKAGTDLELVATGLVDAGAMFKRAVAQNNAFTWGLRIFGLAVMFAGTRLLFNPLAALGRFVPFISRLLQAGITIFCAVLAAMLSLVVMGTAWFAYRPLLTIVLLMVAAALGIGVGMKYRKTAIG